MSGVMTGQVGRIAGLELGGFRLPGVVATFPDSAFENPRGLDSRDGNLGSGFLGRFNITFDFPGSRMFLAKNRRFADPFEWDMSGVRFDLDEAGVLAATEVQVGSPAATGGIVPGDVLLAVDGVPADPRGLQRERARFREQGRVVTLRLRSKAGTERDVKLTLRRLI
jgi:membrane-associated protease RseP (regulator of RpoE activity)